MKLFFTVILTFICFITYSQSVIIGRVMNDKAGAISDANILLLTVDSVYIASELSSNNGTFVFKNAPKTYRLIIQKFGYYPLLLSGSATKNKNGEYSSSIGNINLVRNLTILDNVEVKASRPIFKSKDDGSFTFSVKRMLEKNTVSNAWDLIDVIPFVQQNEDSYSIIGSTSTTITINGRKSSMTTEQIKDLLESTEPQKIKRIDIYYNTPASHNVKGASINIELERPRTEKLKAQWNAYMSIYQCNSTYGVASSSILLSKKKWSLDLSISIGDINRAWNLFFDSNHKYNNQTSHVLFNSKIKPKKFSQLVKADFSVDLKNNHSLSIFYSGRFNSDKRDLTSDMEIDELAENSVHSINNERGHSYIQIFNANYKYKKLNIGGDYTYYSKDITQFITETDRLNSQQLQYDSHQKVNQANLYFSNSNVLKYGILEYGTNVSTISSKNYQISNITTKSPEDNTNYNQKITELDCNIFASWKQNIINKKFIYNITLGLQYFKSSVAKNDTKNILWETVKLFPNITLQYNIKEYKHKLQLDLSSKETYPTYAQLSPRRLYINSYCVDVGNPLLKPFQTYQLNLNYIFLNKYIFGIKATAMPNYIFQQIVQSSNSLSMDGRMINFNKNSQLGVTAVIPINIAKIINSKINGELYYASQSATTEYLSFNRKKIQCKLNITNNSLLNKAKTLGLKISLSYATPSIYGIYDIAHTWNLSTEFSYSPRYSGWSMSLKVNDILNTSNEKIKVNIGSQNYKYNEFRNNRMAIATIRYNFGKYKESKSKNIDTSRMQ